MAVQTRNSAKMSKASKTSTSSVSTRNKRRSGGQNKSRNNDDVSVVSDEESPNNNVLISPRQDEFSERTWWMVDIEHNNFDEEEGKNSTNIQGATALVKRCMRVYGWSLQKTRRILTAYRQFIILKCEHKDWDATELSPSYIIDQMWHQHILDVVNYCHDMMLLCGRVVGHNPDGSLRGKTERDESTRNALERRFPNYDKEIWGIETNSEAGDNDGKRGSEESVDIGDGVSEPNNNNTTRGVHGVTRNSGTANNGQITVRVKHNQTGEETPLTMNEGAKMATVF